MSLAPTSQPARARTSATSAWFCRGRRRHVHAPLCVSLVTPYAKQSGGGRRPSLHAPPPPLASLVLEAGEVEGRGAAGLLGGVDVRPPHQQQLHHLAAPRGSGAPLHSAARELTAARPWAASRGGSIRARSHSRFVLPLIRFIPDALTYSVPLLLKRQCDPTLGSMQADPLTSSWPPVAAAISGVVPSQSPRSGRAPPSSSSRVTWGAVALSFHKERYRLS
jgi:hypothetical protein